MLKPSYHTTYYSLRHPTLRHHLVSGPLPPRIAHRSHRLLRHLKAQLNEPKYEPVNSRGSRTVMHSLARAVSSHFQLPAVLY